MKSQSVEVPEERQRRERELVVDIADDGSDPLVPVEAGRHTAAQIPGSTLTVIPGMGHDIATRLIPILVEAIANHCGAADRQSKLTRVVEKSG